MLPDLEKMLAGSRKKYLCQSYFQTTILIWLQLLKKKL